MSIIEFDRIKIDSLLRELLLSQESYAIRFQPIADHWRKIVEEYKNDA